MLFRSGRGVDHVRAAERIADWALHPSVVLAVVPHSVDDVEAGRIIAAVRPLKGTMLAGLEVDGTQPPDAVPAALVAAVDCLLLRLPGEEMPHEAWRSRQPAKPLDAGRSVACGDVAEQRRECDRLQADLAAWGLAGGADRLPWDWAGYLAAAW